MSNFSQLFCVRQKSSQHQTEGAQKSSKKIESCRFFFPFSRSAHRALLVAWARRIVESVWLAHIDKCTRRIDSKDSDLSSIKCGRGTDDKVPVLLPRFSSVAFRARLRVVSDAFSLTKNALLLVRGYSSSVSFVWTELADDGLEKIVFVNLIEWWTSIWKSGIASFEQSSCVQMYLERMKQAELSFNYGCRTRIAFRHRLCDHFLRVGGGGRSRFRVQVKMEQKNLLFRRVFAENRKIYIGKGKQILKRCLCS